MITITLIANAGVLIEYKNTKLLLDGIQNEGDFPFSKTPPEILTQMLSGHLTFYNNIDYVVFSHIHPDHFSPSLTAQYICKNKVKRLIFPDSNLPEADELLTVLKKSRTPYWTFKMHRKNLHCYRLSDEISIISLCTQHMPQLFGHDLCQALLFDIHGIKLLFMSDCSCREESLIHIFHKMNIHTVFINPYFYHDKTGRLLLENVLCPHQTVIYHIPFVNDDKIHLRALTQQDIKKYPRKNLILFNEPYQTLTI